VAFAKIVLHQLWSSLSDPKVGTNVVHHFLNVYGTDTAQRVRLHILVQQFIRIQFRAVRWQTENPDLRRMFCQPTTHRSRLVYRVTIHNQKHFPPGLPRQSQETGKKIQKHPRRETLTENHEDQPPPIGDGRDHVAARDAAHESRNQAALPVRNGGSGSASDGEVQQESLRARPIAAFLRQWPECEEGRSESSL